MTVKGFHITTKTKVHQLTGNFEFTNSKELIAFKSKLRALFPGRAVVKTFDQIQKESADAALKGGQYSE